MVALVGLADTVGTTAVLVDLGAVIADLPWEAVCGTDHHAERAAAVVCFP